MRHAICFAGGANGNVAGYNSSCVPIFDFDSTYSDMSLNEEMLSILADGVLPEEARGAANPDYLFHGHYPFSNLVEGNVVQYFAVDDIWGSNGPYNMFF